MTKKQIEHKLQMTRTELFRILLLLAEETPYLEVYDEIYKVREHLQDIIENLGIGENNLGKDI